MSHEPTILYIEADPQPPSHLVHAVARFAVVVRSRWRVVAGALVVSGALGALYYATATRYFAAKAALVVIDTGGDPSTTGVTGEGTSQLGAMPTYTSLITYPKVLQGALAHLGPEDRVDLADAPSEKWVGLLRAGLSARTVRGTNIIEIGYLSRDRLAAVAVVNAVVASYREFLDRTHRGAAGEVGRTLAKQMSELDEKIAKAQEEVLQARRAAGDIRLREDGRVVHPVLQRVTAFNEQWIAVQKQRVELETSLAAVEAAVRGGDDLQQHVMRIADVVGREMLLRSLGFDPRDAATQAALERDLLEERAELRAMEEHLAPAHSEVLAAIERIRLKESYLHDYPRRVNDWLARLQTAQLGPKLVEMVRQKLDEVRQLEGSVRAQYEQAHAEASRLNVLLTDLENKERDLKRLQMWNEKLLDQLTDINLRQDGQDVRTEIVQAPEPPPGPVVPNKARVALLVLLGGIGAGLVLVYVLDTLDDRFRSAEEMQSQLGVAVLAMVGRLEAEPSRGLEGLQVHLAPDAPASEAFRTLRTALALADGQASRIVVSSPEPGDGKTTILANLAAAYAQSDKRTLVIDADLRRPGLTSLLGLRGVEGLSAVLRGNGDIARAAAARVRPSGLERLDVLPSGPRSGDSAELLSGPRLAELLAWAETAYDQILIDSPPALATSDAAMIGRLVDGVVLVVQPGKNRRRGVIRCVEGFRGLKIPVLGVVVNRLAPEDHRGYCGYGVGYGYGYTAEDAGEPDEIALAGAARGDAI